MMFCFAIVFDLLRFVRPWNCHRGIAVGSKTRPLCGFTLAIIGISFLAIQPARVLGQIDIGVIVDVADVDIQINNVALANKAEQAKTLLYQQMRGLIQNELWVIDSVCALDDQQRQSLVNAAEEEWRAKTNASVLKRMQQHVYGTIDLDSLAERVVRDWLLKAGTAEQVAKYDEELADRMVYRKQALVSKMLDMLSEKLKLGSSQMKQIEAVLNEKWRDRWFRSLEATFENPSQHPEIRPVWISSILSDAQRAALVTRENQVSFSTFAQSSFDPSLDLSIRFQMGTIRSSDNIELEPEIKKRNLLKAQAIENDLEEPKGQDNDLPR